MKFGGLIYINDARMGGGEGGAGGVGGSEGDRRGGDGGGGKEGRGGGEEYSVRVGGAGAAGGRGGAAEGSTGSTARVLYLFRECCCAFIARTRALRTSLCARWVFGQFGGKPLSYMPTDSESGDSCL
jgi:hypothetical protein